MRRISVILLILSLLLVGAVYAQDNDTPEPETTPDVEATAEATPEETREPVMASVPGAEAAVLEPIIALEDDTRLSVCTAPTNPDFRPHIVRPGDTLADLLTNAPSFVTATQVAALNCLEDPLALSVGTVIWLPTTNADAFADFEPNAIPDGDPEIVAFASAEQTFANQTGTSFSWETDAAFVYFYSCSAVADDCDRPVTAPMLPPQVDEYVVENVRYAGPLTYRLEAVAGDTAVSRDVTVAVVCSQESLAPVNTFARCPDEPPLTIFAAWQPFQTGAMMWFSDTDDMWVLTNDGRVQVFADPYAEGTPDPPDEAPEGLLTPIRGFGQVWRSLGGAEESGLGWAMATEIGFDSGRQQLSSQSFTSYIKGPGDVVYAVTLIPGTNEGIWTQVAE